MTLNPVSSEVFQPSAERGDIYYDERVMLAFMRNVIDIGRKQSSRYYETEEMAKRARARLIERLGKAAGKVAGLDEIPLRLGGSGIMVPAIMFGDGNDDEHDMHLTRLAINNRMPLTPLRAPTTVDAVYKDTVVLTKTVNDTGKPPYQNTITVVASQLERNNFRKIVTVNGAEVAQIVIKHNYLIDTANKDISVEIPILSDLIERREAINHLAVHGIRRSRLVHEVKTLGRAMAEEDADDFIRLRKVDILHNIARSSEIYLSQEACSGDDISSILLSTIGRGREIKVSGKGFNLDKPEELYELPNAAGFVFDTMTLAVGDEPVETPVLVVEDDDRKYFLPFKHIDSFSF